MLIDESSGPINLGLAVTGALLFGILFVYLLGFMVSPYQHRTFLPRPFLTFRAFHTWFTVAVPPFEDHGIFVRPNCALRPCCLSLPGTL